MECQELANRYKAALEKRDFVAMASLAALCIAEMPQKTLFTIEHFGVCPKCFQTDGCLHVGKDEWFVCHEHKAKWHVGENLFSAWRGMMDEEFGRNHVLLDSYEGIEAFHGLQKGYVETVKIALDL